MIRSESTGSGFLRTLRIAGLPLLWLCTAALMILDHLRDPYDPSRHGTATYGHNAEGAFASTLAASLIELVVVLAILRPWSYSRSWGRAASALGLLVPWCVVSGIAAMHAGGLLSLHLLWVVELTALTGALLLWRGGATIVAAVSKP